MKLSLRKAFKSLALWIFVALLLGMVVGFSMGEGAAIFEPLGRLFIQLIKMLVVPLVLVSIVVGASALGASKSAGKVGFFSLVFIFVTTMISIGLAIFADAIFQPGQSLDSCVVQAYASPADSDSATYSLSFWDTIIGMIPANPVEALATGNVLQIIVFGLFLGFGISALPSAKKAAMTRAFDSILEALVWCIAKVMWVAPIGVFGLMAEAMGTYGFDILIKIANLLWINILVVLAVALLLYPLILLIFTKISISRYFKAMLRPQIVAFSTASSLATMPVNMDTCEKDLGVSKPTVSFVIPLGATVNMTGNAIYYTLVALFFARYYGIDLALTQYIAISFTAALGSVGMAGVPGPTLLVVAVLACSGIPLDGLPLLYALDRLFDMIRTTLNITGDAVCALVMDRFVGQSISSGSANQ